jgi:hypothetical protein
MQIQFQLALCSGGERIMDVVPLSLISGMGRAGLTGPYCVEPAGMVEKHDMKNIEPTHESFDFLSY